MEKFAQHAPCPYHGLQKPGAKYTNVIYNGGGYLQKQKHNHQQQQQPQHRVNGGGEAPKTVEPIWDIVSGLAQALNDAKDQLASLLQSRSSSPQRLAFANGANHVASNGNSCLDTHGGLGVPRKGSPRCYSAPHRRRQGPQRGGEEDDSHDLYTRNIHRSHAHGYCAFGRNTEFKEKMHHNGTGTRIQTSSGRGSGRGGGGGGVGYDGYGGNYGIKLQGGRGAFGVKVIPNGNSYSCKRDRGKDGLHLQAKMKKINMNVDTEGEKFDPSNPMKIRFSAPSKVRYPSHYRQQHPQPTAEVKRYCVGTQYANLLREEAHHLREKRIREENKIMKQHSFLIDGRQNVP